MEKRVYMVCERANYGVRDGLILASTIVTPEELAARDFGCWRPLDGRVFATVEEAEKFASSTGERWDRI